jgi:hypothetical protein
MIRANREKVGFRQAQEIDKLMDKQQQMEGKRAEAQER